MTISASGPCPEDETGTSDLDLLQLFEDGEKLLTTSPLASLARGVVYDSGRRFAGLLDSMLSTAAAERRLRDQS